MSELRDIELSLPMQLLQAREAAMAQFRPMLRKHGLTEQQWRVLRVLAANRGVDASELANRCFLLAPSLSRILQALESEGLIRRATDGEDNRRTLISLTRAGTSTCKQVGPDAEALYQSIEKRFGSKNLKQLYQLLTQLSDAIGS
ncbi:MAG: homoprotocatechuate degradation operon regulator HpaR [Pseudomonadales bacterium]